MGLLSILLVIAIAVYVIVVIIGYNKQRILLKTSKVFETMTQKDKQMKLFFIEKNIIEKLNIKAERIKPFIYLERFVIISAIIISYFIVGFVGFGFVLGVVVNLYFADKTRQLIDSEGLENIAPTLDFINFFCPTVVAGSSTEQALLKYIKKLDDDNIYKQDLMEYYTALKEDNLAYHTPEKIKDIVEVYSNAAYNEELGIDNYLAVVDEEKDSLFKKQNYYNKYKNEFDSVINPIKISYTVFLPIIVFLTLNMVGDFWKTVLGLIVILVVVIIYVAFQRLLFNLNKSTIEKIL